MVLLMAGFSVQLTATWAFHRPSCDLSKNRRLVWPDRTGVARAALCEIVLSVV